MNYELTPEVITEIKNLCNESVLCWLATVNAAGQPNVSPKEIFVFDEMVSNKVGAILIAHIASPQSVANLLINPKASLVILDIFVQKGLQLTGQAEVIAASESRFFALAKPLLALTQVILRLRQ